MAYDGLFIKAQISEIFNVVINEHIAKITERSPKEINFHIRKNNRNLILTLSANPNFPYILLNEKDVGNSKTPPAFCMLLRKYLQGAVIKGINQIGKNFREKFDKNLYLERIVQFDFENINENGDIAHYFLYFEIMGKYSNIVLTDSEKNIIDVLIKSNLANPRLAPKLKYDTKDIANKNELIKETFDGFMANINQEIALSSINDEEFDLSSAISKKYAGLSKPYVMHEIINYIMNSKPDFKKENFSYNMVNKIISSKESFKEFFNRLKIDTENIVLYHKIIKPVVNYKGNKPSDFYIFKLHTYEGEVKEYKRINDCLDAYIQDKYIEINDTSEKKNLDSIVKSLYTKLNKKLEIYKKDLSKCSDIDTIKNYGELVSAFGYNLDDIENGILTCKDYNHDDAIVKIPIDEYLTVAQNVERYYDKYNKLKRTKENAEKLIDEVNKKLEHLNSISYTLSLPNDKNDLYMIKEEILKYFDEANKINELNKQRKDISERKKVKTNSRNKLNYNIHHYKSSNGIDIFVGKNNLQNEYLTFTLASPDDTWLHIKNASGSHVIIKKPYVDLDDKTLVEAASLAAYFSEKKNETKATVDYTLRKELKKVKGKAPGFCIYHKNYSINVKPEILIKEI